MISLMFFSEAGKMRRELHSSSFERTAIRMPKIFLKAQQKIVMTYR